MSYTYTSRRSEDEGANNAESVNLSTCRFLGVQPLHHVPDIVDPGLDEFVQLDQEVISLAVALTAKHSTVSLRLCDCNPTDQVSKDYLATGAKPLSTLRIDNGPGYCDPVFSNFLYGLLGSSISNIAHLSLTRINLSVSDICGLTKALFECLHPLITLDLSSNQLPSDAIFPLGVLLRSSIGPSTLNLSHNCLSDYGVAALGGVFAAEALRDSPLAQPMQKTPACLALNLTSLNLADNQIGDAGLRKLIHGVMTRGPSFTLSSLVLDSNLLTGSSIQHSLLPLVGSSCLPSHLSLSGNPMSATSLLPFLYALISHDPKLPPPRLSALHLGGISLNAELLYLFAALLHFSDSLASLQLQLPPPNQLSGASDALALEAQQLIIQGLMQIAEAVQACPSLTDLQLDGACDYICLEPQRIGLALLQVEEEMMRRLQGRIEARGRAEDVGGKASGSSRSSMNVDLTNEEGDEHRAEGMGESQHIHALRNGAATVLNKKLHAQQHDNFPELSEQRTWHENDQRTDCDSLTSCRASDMHQALLCPEQSATSSIEQLKPETPASVSQKQMPEQLQHGCWWLEYSDRKSHEQVESDGARDELAEALSVGQGLETGDIEGRSEAESTGQTWNCLSHREGSEQAGLGLRRQNGKFDETGCFTAFHEGSWHCNSLNGEARDGVVGVGHPFAAVLGTEAVSEGIEENESQCDASDKSRQVGRLASNEQEECIVRRMGSQENRAIAEDKRDSKLRQEGRRARLRLMQRKGGGSRSPLRWGGRRGRDERHIMKQKGNRQADKPTAILPSVKIPSQRALRLEKGRFGWTGAPIEKWKLKYEEADIQGPDRSDHSVGNAGGKQLATPADDISTHSVLPSSPKFPSSRHQPCCLVPTVSERPNRGVSTRLPGHISGARSSSLRLHRLQHLPSSDPPNLLTQTVIPPARGFGPTFTTSMPSTVPSIRPAPFRTSILPYRHIRPSSLHHYRLVPASITYMAKPEEPLLGWSRSNYPPPLQHPDDSQQAQAHARNHVQLDQLQHQRPQQWSSLLEDLPGSQRDETQEVEHRVEADESCEAYPQEHREQSQQPILEQQQQEPLECKQTMGQCQPTPSAQQPRLPTAFAPFGVWPAIRDLLHRPAFTSESLPDRQLDLFGAQSTLATNQEVVWKQNIGQRQHEQRRKAWSLSELSDLSLGGLVGNPTEGAILESGQAADLERRRSTIPAVYERSSASGASGPKFEEKEDTRTYAESDVASCQGYGRECKRSPVDIIEESLGQLEDSQRERSDEFLRIYGLSMSFLQELMHEEVHRFAGPEGSAALKPDEDLRGPLEITEIAQTFGQKADVARRIVSPTACSAAKSRTIVKRLSTGQKWKVPWRPSGPNQLVLTSPVEFSSRDDTEGGGSGGGEICHLATSQWKAENRSEAAVDMAEQGEASDEGLYDAGRCPVWDVCCWPPQGREGVSIQGVDGDDSCQGTDKGQAASDTEASSRPAGVVSKQTLEYLLKRVIQYRRLRRKRRQQVWPLDTEKKQVTCAG